MFSAPRHACCHRDAPKICLLLDMLLLTPSQYHALFWDSAAQEEAFGAEVWAPGYQLASAYAGWRAPIWRPPLRFPSGLAFSPLTLSLHTSYTFNAVPATHSVLIVLCGLSSAGCIVRIVLCGLYHADYIVRTASCRLFRADCIVQTDYCDLYRADHIVQIPRSPILIFP